MSAPLKYEPIGHHRGPAGEEEWLFRFTRHDLRCDVTVTAWPTGNWGWQTLIDSRGAAVKRPPELTELDRLRHGLFRPGPAYLPEMLQIGGMFPNLSLSATLEMALEQLDQLYAEAEKE